MAQRSAVALQIRLQRHVAARGKDGGAVIAQIAVHQNGITRRDMGRAQIAPGGMTPTRLW
jgi:hypothetical protein